MKPGKEPLLLQLPLLPRGSTGYNLIQDGVLGKIYHFAEIITRTVVTRIRGKCLVYWLVGIAQDYFSPHRHVAVLIGSRAVHVVQDL